MEENGELRLREDKFRQESRPFGISLDLNKGLKDRNQRPKNRLAAHEKRLECLKNKRKGKDSESEADEPDSDIIKVNKGEDDEGVS